MRLHGDVVYARSKAWARETWSIASARPPHDHASSTDVDSSEALSDDEADDSDWQFPRVASES
jgi:hypothetical protein